MRPPEATPGGISPRLGPVVLAVLALGAALRLWQYAADASQWVDELALSRGILGLSWPALWSGRLPYWQEAPRGFTLLEKAGAVLWGASDYGLRLLPLACSLAALWLFALLARRLLAHRAAVAFAVALFAVQPELIRYAAQVKPYSGDLAVALALTLLAAGLADAGDQLPARRALLAGAVAPVAVLLSNAAALVLAGLGVGLLAGAVVTGRRRALPRLGITAAIWSLAAGAAALAASWEMPRQLRDYFANYWAPGLGRDPTRSPAMRNGCSRRSRRFSAPADLDIPGQRSTAASRCWAHGGSATGGQRSRCCSSHRSRWPLRRRISVSTRSPAAWRCSRRRR